MSEEYKQCECYSNPDDCDFLGSTCSHTDCFVKDLLAENKRLREALEKIATCNYSDKKATNLEWCKVTAKQALGE